MVKTTIYLPEELKRAVERTAAEEGRSEADLIREAVRLRVARRLPPEPLVPLFDSGELPANLSENVDGHLRGFGRE